MGSATGLGSAARLDSAAGLDWDKGGGLIPAIVQDAGSGAVLMLGYMNREALAATHATGRVTFWSRSKDRLWTKGESSGHFLELRQIAADCDGDTLLILAEPMGPACHKGTATCWGQSPPESAAQQVAFLGRLERVIAQRIEARPPGSYTAKLLVQGTRRIAQKVGEEGLELALAAVAQSDAEVIGEAADLLYHTLLLLRVKGLSLSQVVAELAARHADRPAGASDHTTEVASAATGAGDRPAEATGPAAGVSEHPADAADPAAGAADHATDGH